MICRRFTLVEVLIVLAMLGILLTLATGRPAAFPAAAGMEKTVRELERLFAKNSHAAAMSGKTGTIVYDPETHSFAIAAAAPEANARFLLERYGQAAIHPDIEITFPTLPARREDPVCYRSFPDGAAEGPDLILKLGASRLRLGISPLTGRLVRRDNRGNSR